ncbi:MAG: nitroreductase family protein [Mangrovibacterium sp.]|nr:nitroreductase family protein [Mangrovibacterium sp.]
MDFLFQHRSIRQYKADEVGDDLLTTVIEAGTRASTTGNMQLYSVVITRDPANKTRLAPLHFNQAAVVQAPVLLTVCADVNRFGRWCACRNADASYDHFLWMITAVIDAMLFAQNICIAAESQGLGICYMGTTLYHACEISDVLKLPRGVLPVTAVTMGYPAHDPGLTARLPVGAVIHDESYKDYSKEQIDALYREQEALESSRRFVEENGKDNLAQVFTDVRYPRKDSLYFSEKLMEAVRKQGFKI